MYKILFIKFLKVIFDCNNLILIFTLYAIKLNNFISNIKSKIFIKNVITSLLIC